MKPGGDVDPETVCPCCTRRYNRYIINAHEQAREANYRRLMEATADLVEVVERVLAKDGIAGLRGELRAAVQKARGEG